MEPTFASRAEILSALRQAVAVIEVTAGNLDKMKQTFAIDIGVGNLVWQLGSGYYGVAYFWPDHGGPGATVIRNSDRTTVAVGTAVIENGAPHLRMKDGALFSLLAVKSPA
jgi:hypothetical protein